MKKMYILSLLILLSGVLTYAQEYTGSAADRKIKGAKELRYRKGGTIPDYIELNKNSQFTVENLGNWLGENYHVSAPLSFLATTGLKDKMNATHQRYRQTYNNIPLFDANFSVHSQGNLVFSINGTIRDKVELGNQVLLTEAQALVFALNRCQAEVYKWEVPGNEAFIKYLTHNPDATYYPKGQLVLYPDHSADDNLYKYAYVFNVYSSKPLAREEIYIDAQDGDVLFENNRIHNSDSTGIALTKYSGTREIKTSFVSEEYILRETERGLGIETYDLNQGTDYGSAADFVDADNYWNNINPEFDEVATDAHWAAEMTYDYFWNVHNRNSIDSLGYKLVSYVHYDVGYANAFWDGEVMTYGDGDNEWTPLTAVDICGHEITHGLTTFTSNLIYSYESGALNEAYSDIFGTSIEFYAKPATANWTMGEDIGGIIRDMANPNSMGDPDTYQGNNWYTGSGDYGGVHTNSNVLNYWFYLLSVGGSGVNDLNDAYNVTGIGINQAGAIAFRTNTVYMHPDYEYAEARFYSLKSATDLFNGCSPEVESTANAFYAVGVGSMYNPEVIATFDASVTASCTLPVSVTFINTSNNGMHYLWDFGDGTTDTLSDPVHVYTSEGNYTVSLQVDGGPCGADTLEMSSFINIDTPDTPIVTSASNCGGEASLTLTAIAPDSVRWYMEPVGGTSFHSGTSYTTPVLTESTHYYVDNSIEQPDLSGGKPDNSGSGGYFNFWNTHYLEFDVFTPAIIKTVKVYAQGSGDRVITLLDNNDVELASSTIYIQDGESVITLNYNVPVGNGFKLQGPGNCNLYRNNSGMTYPYLSGNILSIVSSDAGENRYYYFYDWVVGQQPCISERVQVSAFINYNNPVASFTYTSLPLTIQFTNTSIDGNTYLWDFGDGTTSTAENPVHTYASAAQYTVSLTVYNSCGIHATSQQVVVLASGLPEAQQVFTFTVSPVPATDNIRLNLESAEMDHASISLYDLLGNTLKVENIGKVSGHWHKTIDISDLKEGTYFVRLKYDTGMLTRRIIVQ
jgi:Zn-dependent metalloprotease